MVLMITACSHILTLVTRHGELYLFVGLNYLLLLDNSMAESATITAHYCVLSSLSQRPACTYKQNTSDQWNGFKCAKIGFTLVFCCLFFRLDFLYQFISY